MNAHGTLESDAAPTQQPDGHAHVVRETREIPRVVGDGLLAALLDISADTYARRKRRGDYAFLLMRPQPAGRTQYSGALVARWLNGEDLSAIGVSRFFAKGRPALQHAERRAGAGRPKGRTNQVARVAVLVAHTDESRPADASRQGDEVSR